MGKKVILLVVVGTILWSLTMVKSGLCWDAACASGVGFWGPNGHDGVWHIALANSLARGSIEMPIFAGQQLQNYHIGFDLVLALLNRITSIPVINLYFQIIPPLIAAGIGILTYTFVYQWKGSKAQAWWAVFFVYFGGSWGWVFGGGESMFWSQQSLSTLINPPFALSLLLLLFGLILLKKGKWIIAAIILGILVQVKVYAGVLALGSLFVAAFYHFLRSKDLNLFKPLLVAVPLSVLLFLPLNSGSGSLLVWQPFWFLETMMGLSDRVGWPRFYEAMINYRSGGNIIKMVLAYGVAFAIFWFGNLGPRVIKELHFIKFLKKPLKADWQDIFAVTAIVAGVVFPMFFLQSGTPWNTIQFFYYSLMFSGILAGISMGEIWESKKVSLLLKYGLSALLIAMVVPISWSTLQHYLPSRPPAKLSISELEALDFLAQQPNGIVLTYLYDPVKAQEAISNPPRSLYLYESTAYVSAYGNKPVFLEDEVNLNIMNYNWPQRREEVERFYESLDEEYAYNFLRENNIRYVYWVKPQRARLGETQLGIEQIFENDEVFVYKVK